MHFLPQPVPKKTEIHFYIPQGFGIRNFLRLLFLLRMAFEFRLKGRNIGIQILYFRFLSGSKGRGHVGAVKKGFRYRRHCFFPGQNNVK